jgi:site-specific DNA-methyltransferase (adenine-specific)
MNAFYEEDGITIFHGDCRDVPVQQIPDVIITDPPYGIAGAKNSLINGTSKGDYDTDRFEDTQAYVCDVVIPWLSDMRRITHRAVLTPGQINIHKYPEPNHIGVFYYPASTSISRWGMRLWQPIFYYGKDPYHNKMLPDSRTCYDSDRVTDHPCPKPIASWKWLVARASLPGELILDPFMGSGTTIRAAKDLGRRAIGIEIEEKYCEIAAKRLSQKVFEFNP